MAAASPSPAAAAKSLRDRLHPAHLVLAGILVLALALRLVSIKHGLPYVYNADEELHFVPHAVNMIGGSLNPHYFENPPGLTYFFYILFKLRFTTGFPFGDDGFVHAFRADPESTYVTARVAVALIGTLVVWLVYWAGARFFDRRVGLIAAALIAVTFLPVFYSKQALNDVVTMAPVTLALIGCLVVFERGRRWDFALAGVALGVAAAVKYTAGGMVLVLLLAALFRWRNGDASRREALIGVVIAGVAALAAFLVLNPFALLDFHKFGSQLHGEGGQGRNAKLGQDDVPGWIYFLWTFTWSFGWAPILASIAGGVLAVFRSKHWRRGVLLITFPLLLFLVLGAQGRFFARWLLPIYPMLAILAGYAAVRLVDALPLGRLRDRSWARPVLLAVVGALLCVQGLAESVHVDSVLAKTDTRTQARGWLFSHVPPGQKIVVEPFLPDGFFGVRGRTSPPRYVLYPVRRPFQAYEKKLRPELLDVYRRGGFCWVVTASTQRQRGFKAGLRRAKSYYRRLDRESAQTITFSPFARGKREPFNFDLSFNYEPSVYERPGPIVQIHRLKNCG
jgi:dolichyl-phosphate-mannose-protein mannosyltransferase